MGDQLYLERFVWFDHEARKERYTNANTLGEPCHFWSNKGCKLPRDERPDFCNIYLCKRAEQLLIDALQCLKESTYINSLEALDSACGKMSRISSISLDEY